MDPSQKKQALITSLKLLAATPKSRSQLSERLLEKGYEEDVVSEVLKELETQGVLNDKAFAENIKSRYVHAKPSGSRRIDFELKRRGISGKLRQEILGQMNPEEEFERAKELGYSKWQKLALLRPEQRKKRIYDFLIRRGFDYPLVRNIITEFERLDQHEG